MDLRKHFVYIFVYIQNASVLIFHNLFSTKSCRSFSQSWRVCRRWGRWISVSLVRLMVARNRWSREHGCHPEARATGHCFCVKLVAGRYDHCNNFLLTFFAANTVLCGKHIQCLQKSMVFHFKKRVNKKLSDYTR